MTLAPRSCPSRPGLATRTRMGLLGGAAGVVIVVVIKRQSYGDAVGDYWVGAPPLRRVGGADWHCRILADGGAGRNRIGEKGFAGGMSRFRYRPARRPSALAGRLRFQDGGRFWRIRRSRRQPAMRSGRRTACSVAGGSLLNGGQCRNMPAPFVLQFRHHSRHPLPAHAGRPTRHGAY